MKIRVCPVACAGTWAMTRSFFGVVRKPRVAKVARPQIDIRTAIRNPSFPCPKQAGSWPIQDRGERKNSSSNVSGRGSWRQCRATIPRTNTVARPPYSGSLSFQGTFFLSSRPTKRILPAKAIMWRTFSRYSTRQHSAGNCRILSWLWRQTQACDWLHLLAKECVYVFEGAHLRVSKVGLSSAME